MINWEKLKTEYVTGQMRYKDLAEKYKIPYSTLKIHARCDHWVEERENHVKSTMEKSLSLIGDRQAEDLARVDQLADELLTKLQTAVKELDLVVIQHKEKGESQDCKWEKSYEETAPGGTVDRQGLKQLAACLKDLKQVKAIQTELEKLEQEGRIQKLQKEAKEDMDREITVTLEGPLSDYSV